MLHILGEKFVLLEEEIALIIVSLDQNKWFNLNAFVPSHCVFWQYLELSTAKNYKLYFVGNM